jgi:hypothetical protein
MICWHHADLGLAHFEIEKENETYNINPFILIFSKKELQLRLE